MFTKNICQFCHKDKDYSEISNMLIDSLAKITNDKVLFTGKPYNSHSVANNGSSNKQESLLVAVQKEDGRACFFNATSLNGEWLFSKLNYCPYCRRDLTHDIYAHDIMSTMDIDPDKFDNPIKIQEYVKGFAEKHKTKDITKEEFMVFVDHMARHTVWHEEFALVDWKSDTCIVNVVENKEGYYIGVFKKNYLMLFCTMNKKDAYSFQMTRYQQQNTEYFDQNHSLRGQINTAELDQE